MKTLTFRIASFPNNDFGKTIIRIDKKHMQDLGIESGDVVKVVGNRDTAAICLPMEQLANQRNPNFIFLDDAAKNIPLITMGNPVCSNVREGGIGRLVQVSKTRAVEASKVTLATCKAIMPYEEKDLFLDKLEGLVIGTGDGVSVPHGDLFNTLPFLVTDASPSGGFWVITKSTKFELTEISEEEFYKTRTSKLDRLLSVIPIVKQVTTEYFDLTFPSLEVYENATRFYFYMKDRISNPREGIHATAFPTIKAWDDLGNSYEIMDWQGHGGRQVGFNDFEYEMSGVLVPVLDSKARELNFVILEMVWQIMMMPSPGVAPSEPNKENGFNYMRPAEMVIKITSGPWEFKIPLK